MRFDDTTARQPRSRGYLAFWCETHPKAKLPSREKLIEMKAAHIAEYDRAMGASSGRNRRSRLMGAEGTHTAADVRVQYDRQRGLCRWCGRRVTWAEKQVDHVMPLALGGSNGPENLAIACLRCNSSKGAKHPKDWRDQLKRERGTISGTDGNQYPVVP